MNINNDQKQLMVINIFSLMFFWATLFFKVLYHPSSTQPGLRYCQVYGVVVLGSLSLVTDLEESLVETGIQLDKEMG